MADKPFVMREIVEQGGPFVFVFVDVFGFVPAVDAGVAVWRGEPVLAVEKGEVPAELLP